MSDYGIKITKEGKEADSTNSLDYVLNSKYPNAFTSKVGTGNYLFVDASFGVGTVRIATVPHGLTYKPLHIAYLSDDSTKYCYLPLNYSFIKYVEGLGLKNTYARFISYCDTTNFYIDFVKTTNGSPPSDASAWKDMTGFPISWKYYIFSSKTS